MLCHSHTPRRILNHSLNMTFSTASGPVVYSTHSPIRCVPRVKRPGRESIYLVVPKSRMRGAIPPPSITSSWHGPDVCNLLLGLCWGFKYCPYVKYDDRNNNNYDNQFVPYRYEVCQFYVIEETGSERIIIYF